jgi:glutathione S-transferase
MTPQIPYLIGPEFSTFVRAARLFCQYHRIPYENGLTYKGETVPFRYDRSLGLHPLGKLPVLVLGSRVLFETTAICRYLKAVFVANSAKQKDVYQDALVDQWAQFVSIYADQTWVRGYLLELKNPSGDGGQIDQAKVEAVTPDVFNMAAILSEQLGESFYLVGDHFTEADAILIPILDYLLQTPLGAEVAKAHPNLMSYTQRARDAEWAEGVL